MRLNETEMVKLLPAWMQEDGGDKGLPPAATSSAATHMHA